jgi:hypothetical protein
MTEEKTVDSTRPKVAKRRPADNRGPELPERETGPIHDTANRGQTGYGSQRHHSHNQPHPWHRRLGALILNRSPNLLIMLRKSSLHCFWVRFPQTRGTLDITEQEVERGHVSTLLRTPATLPRRPLGGSTRFSALLDCTTQAAHSVVTSCLAAASVLSVAVVFHAIDRHGRFLPRLPRRPGAAFGPVSISSQPVKTASALAHVLRRYCYGWIAISFSGVAGCDRYRWNTPDPLSFPLLNTTPSLPASDTPSKTIRDPVSIETPWPTIVTVPPRSVTLNLVV